MVNDSNKDRQQVQDLAKTLSKTLPDDRLSPEGIKQELAETAADPEQRHITRHTELSDEFQALTAADSDLLLDTPHLSIKAPEILEDEVASTQRYAVESLLGSGGMGRVYAVRDLNLQRAVAIKSMKNRGAASRKAITALIHEARITASLEHSGVLPVHDLDFTENGEVFYSMRQVEGMSLGEAIEQSKDSAIVPEIESINDRINLILKVCDTLELAHSQRILHRDIKPDNIMLGKLGEVFVVDWGTALQLDEDTAIKGSRVGTPVFMSPEQARRELPSIQNEVYSIGATLFQLLTFRYHMFADSVDDFWKKKQDGVVDPLNHEERHAIPEPLQAIVLKALAADPRQRYQSAGALARDLRSYQAGLALTAFRDTAWGFFKRWYRRHKRALSAAVAVALPLLILLAVGLGILANMQAEQARHWNLVFEDTFDRQDVGSNWEMSKGHADIIDGNLVISGSGNVEARLLVPHAPLVRLEFEARIPEGVHVCDMSAYMFTTPGVHDYYYEPDGYLFGFGVGNNSRSLLRRSGHIMSLRDDVLIQSGKWHHVVCEKDVSSVRLIVDGVEQLAVQDHYPPRFDDKMYAVLYTFKSTMQIRSVRLYAKSVAERARTIDIADEFFWLGQYGPAARLFEMVWKDHSGTELGDKALYSLALCRIEQERYDDALELLDSLLAVTSDAGLKIAAQLKQADACYRDGRYQQALETAHAAIADVDDPGKYSEAMLFFDETFQLLMDQVQDDSGLMPVFEEYCQWWADVFPRHPTIRRGRFFHHWADTYRHVGNWEDYKRVLQHAIESTLYIGEKNRFVRSLFQARWRGRWNEERLQASKQTGDQLLYMQDLYAMGQFDRLRQHVQQLQQTDQWPDLKGYYKGLQIDMLICEGDLHALERHLGSAVLTPEGKLHLAQCHLANKDPQAALDLLQLNWQELEQRMDKKNPIGDGQWNIAFFCYTMADDRASAMRICEISRRLKEMDINVQGSSWYKVLASVEQCRNTLPAVKKSWSDVASRSMYCRVAERFWLAGDRKQAIKYFKAAAALPHTYWGVIAQKRLEQILQND